MCIRPSPVVALNRAIAVAHHRGPRAGLADIDAIENGERLLKYPFYFAAIGELKLRRGSVIEATTNFKKALQLARSPMERKFYQDRIQTTKS
jgi:RNA polymerase sigma-70 factor (ECF subfamily)